MQNTLSFPHLRTSEIDVNPVFNIVIAYEDFETGKHAKKTCDFLIEHLGGECQLSHQMWKFDVLAVTKLREMAVKDAVQADVIIVSAHGTSELPFEVKTWLESWLMEKTRAIALVGLFDTEEYLENPARSYLAAVAKRAGVEFFAQPGLWPGESREETLPAESRKYNGRTFSLLSNAVNRDKDISHWGINE
jgi:hypothetical protein